VLVLVLVLVLRCDVGHLSAGLCVLAVARRRSKQAQSSRLTEALNCTTAAQIRSGRWTDVAVKRQAGSNVWCGAGQGVEVVQTTCKQPQHDRLSEARSLEIGTVYTAQLWLLRGEVVCSSRGAGSAAPRVDAPCASRNDDDAVATLTMHAAT